VTARRYHSDTNLSDIATIHAFNTFKVILKAAACTSKSFRARSPSPVLLFLFLRVHCWNIATIIVVPLTDPMITMGKVTITFHKPTLPYDLWAEILCYLRPTSIPHIWKSSTTSFARLASVSRQFQQYVEPRLYKNVILQGMGDFGDDYTQQGRHCCLTLQRNHRLASFVQKCTIMSMMERDDGSDLDVEAIAGVLPLLRNLHVLEYYHMNIPQVIYQAIPTLPHLEVLSFVNCNIPKSAEVAPAAFSLRELTIMGSDVSGCYSSLAPFVQKASLASLRLDGYSTDFFFKYLTNGNLHIMENLYIEPTKEQSPQFCSALSHCSSLRTLGFSPPLQSSSYDRADFKLSPKHLQRLVEYTGPCYLAEAFASGRSIRKVRLDQMLTLEDYGFTYRPRHFAASSENRKVFGYALEDIRRSCPLLSELDVVIPKLEAAAVAQIARCCSQLESLKLQALQLSKLVSYTFFSISTLC
jgi:hypothetical protein